MLAKALVSLAVAKVALGHFHLNYPQWRDDSLSNESYSQWQYPCAGVDYGVGNVTDWPLDGGSLKLELGHPWSYVFVNIGLGTNASNFNISLTPSLLNETGAGVFCLPKLNITEDIPDNSLATMQVITIGDTGNALYNCADLRLTSKAKALSNCTSDDGISYKVVTPESDDASGDSSGDESNSGNESDDDKEDTAGLLRVDKHTLAVVVGLAVLVMGMGS